jgi:hypothetical protein
MQMKGRLVTQVLGLDTLPSQSERLQRALIDWPAHAEADEPVAHFAGRDDDPFRRGSVIIESGEQSYQARMRIRRPDGTVGRALQFNMTAKYEDGIVSELGTDDTGFLTFTTEINTKTRLGSYGFSRPRIVGERVDVALPSVEFLNDLHQPNVLQASWESGPFIDYREIPSQAAGFPDSVVEYLRSLSMIQARVQEPILIPDLTTVTAGDVLDVNDAATLLAGESLRSSWARFSWKTGRPRAKQTQTDDGEIDLRDHYQLQIVEPLTVKVGEDALTLGTVRTLLLSVRFEAGDTELRAFPFLNNTMERSFDPDTPPPDFSNRPVLGKSLGPLAEALPQDSVQGPRPRYLRAAGAGRSGRSDISERMEELLVEEVRQ